MMTVSATAADASPPGATNTPEGQHQGQQTGSPSTEGIRQYTEYQSQQCSPQDGNRHHKPSLRRIQAEIRDDGVGQGAQQDPNHKTDVEVKEGTSQRRPVSGSQETT